MNTIIKKLFGIDKIEAQAQKAAELKLKAEFDAQKALEVAADAKEKERIAKLSPKELATENKEPWIQVLTTHINKENVRNGFFELDWNEFFIEELKKSGYNGETDEEVVDKWFQDLCKSVATTENVNMDKRGAGYVNRALRDDGLTEVG